MTKEMQEQYQKERKQRVRSYLLQPLSLIGAGLVLALSLILGLAGDLVAGLLGFSVLAFLYGAIFYTKAASGAQTAIFSDWASVQGWQYSPQMSNPGGTIFLIGDRQEYSDLFSDINLQGHSARMFNVSSTVFYKKSAGRIGKKEEGRGEEIVPSLALQIDMPYRLPLRSLMFQPRLLGGELPALQERMARMFSERQIVNLGMDEMNSAYGVLIDAEDHPGYAQQVLSADFVAALLANSHPAQIIQYEMGQLTIMLLNHSLQADSLDQAEWLLARAGQLLGPLAVWAGTTTPAIQPAPQVPPAAPQIPAAAPQAPQAPQAPAMPTATPPAPQAPPAAPQAPETMPEGPPKF